MKRDMERPPRYFPLPNEIFSLGLNAPEIAVLAYLMYREDRRTFTCHPSYQTIGRALKLSKNTVAKYVRSLEEKRLIRTQYTTFMKDGKCVNGNLEYRILPVREAAALHMDRQMRKLQAEAQVRKNKKKLEQYDRRHKKK